MAWRGVRLALVAYLSVIVMLSAFERWLVFPAPRADSADWNADGFAYEDVVFSADDGAQLHGWYVPHPQPRAYVLFMHGNGEFVPRLRPTLTLLRDRLGVATFAWDYRGYGRSQGKPAETNVLADARTAQLWLARRAGVPPEEIVLWGRSLGGGVAVGLAAQ
ncbi:MAG TPA: alpha/beta fold hydrolase, partial [Lacipirellulaceae bacterium]|nr:alpha/beta fold hydrolase [Lacipirellulaceae bacterium]